MSLLIVIYCIGVIVTLYVYNKYFENTISPWEIALTWYYHLFVMINYHRQHSKMEKEQIKRRSRAWVNEFHKARKIAEEENWTDVDWRNWQDSIDQLLNNIWKDF